MGKKKNEVRLARICWNDNGWEKPSGRNGKSKTDLKYVDIAKFTVTPGETAAFETQHGFGYEEWLFDNRKSYNGYRYGYLQPVERSRKSIHGKVDLILISRNSETNDTMIMGKLLDVEVVDKIEANEVFEHYSSQGWLKEMITELKDVDANYSQIEEVIKKKNGSQLFNIKIKLSQIRKVSLEYKIYAGKKRLVYWYELIDAKKMFKSKVPVQLQKGFDFDSGEKTPAKENRIRRTTAKREIEPRKEHVILQNAFLKYLQKIHGKKNVARECLSNGRRIDVVLKLGKKFTFYEVKVYSHLRYSIRESFGQLLEYSLYSDSKYSENLILVSNIEPTKDDKKYLKHLKTFLKGIDFDYIHFDIKADAIIPWK